MAKNQTIIWTALPNGVTNGQLNLSVFVSPRLWTDEGLPRPTLSEFDDFQKWPDKIKNMKFQVQFEGAAPVDATRVGPDLDPGMWAALFSASTYVQPYQPDDYSNRPVLSHPVLQVASFVKSQYQSFATTSPERLPSRTNVMEKLAPISIYAAPVASSGLSRQAPMMTGRFAKPATGQQSQPAATSQKAEPMTHQAVVSQQLSGFITTLHPNLQASAHRNVQMLMSGSFPLSQNTVSAFQSVYQDLQQHKAIVTSAQAQPAKDFLRFRIGTPELPKTLQPPPPPDVDFHKCLASLGNYPELMKVMGLVINLQVPLPAGLATASTVSVLPKWAPDSPPAKYNSDISPKTAYVFDAGTSWFSPRPEKPDSDIAAGLLKLNDHQSYPVVSIDVDSSATRMANLADRLTSSAITKSQAQPPGMHPLMYQLPSGTGGAQSQEQVETGTQTVESESVQGLPALRTGGLSVAKSGRAQTLVNILSRTAVNNLAIQKNPPEPVTLYAEDVVRGYRIDVWDSQSKSWHSLCRRVGTYNFYGANPGLVRQYLDEGFVQLSATQAADTQSAAQQTPTPQTAPDLYLQESIFSWNGWSLCAPRPGSPINPEGIPQPLNDPNVVQQQQKDGDFKMVATFMAIPGSLPRLRFGETYRVRARVVDLAGNGLGYNDPSPTDFSRATDPHAYLRFEPVVGPLAVLTQSLVGNQSPGEAVYRPVIRSNFDKSADQYAPVFAQLVSDSQYTASSLRLIAPPKTSEIMAERLGMFDLASGGMKKDQATYQMIAQKSKADFLIDPATRLPVQNKLEVPYLSDPLSRGASLVLLDSGGNVAATVPPVSFYPSGADWPEPQPFFIKVVEGTGKTAWSWDAGSRTLSVQLTKGEVAKFQMSSYLGEGQTGSTNLSLLGIWNWVEQAKPPHLDQIRTAAEQGRFWMITPSRELVLVHAVQQPLVAPAFHQLSPNRNLGETFAYIVDDQPMLIDGKSTLKVDFEADWQEMIDDVTVATGPEQQSGHAHSYTWDLQRTDTALALAPMISTAMNDPGGEPSAQDVPEIRLAAYQVKSEPIGRYQPSASTQRQTTQMVKPGQETTAAQQYAIQPGARIPQDFRVIQGPQYQAGVGKLGYSWRHIFGDTKYRKVNFQAIATTRFKEYFPAMSSDQLTRTSAAFSVDVPNSARPPQPGVLYVLPTFGWDRKENVPVNNTGPTIAPSALSGLKGVATASRRIGSGLRIYLERPWFLSGDGELLGVVVWPGSAQTNTTERFTNRWSIRNAAYVLGGSSGQSVFSKQVGPMSNTGVKASLPTSDLLKHVITQWGIDPIWASNPLPGDLPTLANFKNPAKTASGLTLQELEGLKGPTPAWYNVGVAGYQPQFDPDRQLWYCDVEMDAGNTYFPFVRLALVRYQPISVPNAHLSRVVLADLAQLTPDRSAVMVYNPNNPKKIDLVVSGLTYAASSAGKGPSLVEATVESNPSGADDELGWVPVPNGTVVLQPRLIGDQTVWKYELHLGKMKVPKHQPLRLVIKEFEVLDAAATASSGQVFFATGQPMTGRRLIYAETLKVPPIS